MRVWIDDRHPIFRKGLATCLDSEGFRVTGESSAMRPAPELDRIDILMFDAEDGGLRTAVRLVRDEEVRLVALTRASNDGLLVDAMQAGVAALLVRGELSPAALAGTLRAVYHGATTLPSSLVPRLLDRASNSTRGGPTRLTPRELEVLRLLAEGQDTRGIATEMAYSDRTVKNIVHDVLMKLNCRNRAHAVALATRQGLI